MCRSVSRNTADTIHPGLHHTGAALPWRPPYLRRRVLACFLVIFMLLLLAIELLHVISDRNDGLATAFDSQHYFWTYGPTSILTLLAIFWARVEYQSKLIAPWRRLAHQPASSARKTLLLDYISDFQICVLYKSAANKDLSVALTSAVSVMIRILVVISTGFITLSWIPVHIQSYPVTIQDAFVGNATRLNQSDAFPGFMVTAIGQSTLRLPDGVSSLYAFQSFHTDLPSDVAVRTTVEGLTNTLECDTAEMIMNMLPSADTKTSDESVIRFTITSGQYSCRDLFVSSPDLNGTEANNYTASFFDVADCDDTTNKNTTQRLVVMLANFAYLGSRTTGLGNDGHNMSYQAITNRTVNQSTQLLCTPNYRLLDIDVTRNGTEILHLTPLSGSTDRRLNSVAASDFMAAIAQDYLASSASFLSKDPKNPWETKVGYSMLFDAVNFKYGAVLQEVDLYDPSILQKIAGDYYSQMAAIVAKRHLTVATSINSTGSVIQYQQRLVVRNWSAQWMSGILITCCLAVVITLFIVPREGILPRKPGTLLAVATTLVHSHDLLSVLSYSGATEETGLRRSLEKQKFRVAMQQGADLQSRFTITSTRSMSPIQQTWSKTYCLGILHPGLRLSLCVVFFGLILTLELLLQKSQHESGLGNVGSDIYVHYTWTTVPSVALGLFSLVLSSVDFSVVSLAPLLSLRKLISLPTLLEPDLLDMTTPHRILREYRTGNFLALASTLTLIVSSLFTIFSGSLFQAVPFAFQTSAVLRITQSFNEQWTSLSTLHDEKLTNLVLEGDLAYPRFTYGDLAFPELGLERMQLEDIAVNFSSVSLIGVVPAVRSPLICRYYDVSMMTFDNFNRWQEYEVLYVSMPQENCSSSDSRYRPQFQLPPDLVGWGGPAGQGDLGANNIQLCSDLLYIWGDLSDLKSAKTPAEVRNLSAMGCNASFQAVDVDATFLNTELDLDLKKPPTPREETARNTRISVTVGVESIFGRVYAWLAYVRYRKGVNSFFSIMMQSPWAIPLTSLQNPAAAHDVQEAIKFHHGVITAQFLAAFRIPANSTSALMELFLDSSIANKTDAQLQYPSTLTQPNAYIRVTQDPVSTRILEALLGLTLLLFLINWVLMPDISWLPARSPTSIVAAAALIAGGNLADVLPPDAASMDRKGLEAAMGPSWKFRLGWGHTPDPDGNELNENGESRFGIWAIPEDAKEIY